MRTRQSDKGGVGQESGWRFLAATAAAKLLLRCSESKINLAAPQYLYLSVSVYSGLTWGEYLSGFVAPCFIWFNFIEAFGFSPGTLA